MVKMVKQNEGIFTSNSLVFLQVDLSVIFDHRAKDKKQVSSS